MSLRNLFQVQENVDITTEEIDAQPVRRVLCEIFEAGIHLKENQRAQISNQVTAGISYFNELNETRISQAFESFDKPMRYALFETLFLLHINQPHLKNLSYKTFRTTPGKTKDEKVKNVNLYMESTPSGIKAINKLSGVFKQEFEGYIKETFNDRIRPTFSRKEHPIDSVFSTGSVGTLNHHNDISRLDLKIQYNLSQFNYSITNWHDLLLKESLLKEHSLLIQRYFQKKGINNTQTLPKEQEKKASDFFKNRIREKYPLLFQYLVANDAKIVTALGQQDDQKLRYSLILEIIDLLKHNKDLVSKEDIKKKELFLQRIDKIQIYLRDKFPETEINLLPCSRQDLQQGYHQSSLDSRGFTPESYELINNYETLMPGVYFSPAIPTHFLFSEQINNDFNYFERLTNFIQFGLIDFMKEVSNQLNHQGSTPNLDLSYIAGHAPAAYWEAFKTSSENLPKAVLELLRFETLLEEKTNKTIIQLLKRPELLDRFITESNTDLENLTSKDIFYSPFELLELEKNFPNLKFDPCWLRFKALKIAFSVPGRMQGVPEEEKVRVCNIIDLAFALQIRLSDVFTKAEEQKECKKHREKVLLQFLTTVFPSDNHRRKQLLALFIGEIKYVNEFETELRGIFQRSVRRIQEKVEKFNLSVDRKSTRELEIWHHFYENYLKPSVNIVQKSILSHLQIPRGRLRIGFRQKKGWFFNSLQKGITSGERFESSILNFLPEEITLIEHKRFFIGLVYCAINGYYGTYNPGTLNKTETVIEYDGQPVLGSRFDNQLAYIRPEQIKRILQLIVEWFPETEIDYSDFINQEPRIKEVLIFLNLLKYGSLSILSRDNLNTMVVHQVKIPNFVKNVNSYTIPFRKVLQDKNLHISLQRFFSQEGINLQKIRLHTWVNANSVATNYSSTRSDLKEEELAMHFTDLIFQVHGEQNV